MYDFLSLDVWCFEPFGSVSILNHYFCLISQAVCNDCSCRGDSKMQHLLWRHTCSCCNNKTSGYNICASFISRGRIYPLTYKLQFNFYRNYSGLFLPFSYQCVENVIFEVSKSSSDHVDILILIIVLCFVVLNSSLQSLLNGTFE